MIDLVFILILFFVGYAAGGGVGRLSGIFAALAGAIYGAILGASPSSWPAFAIAGMLAESVSPAKYCTGIITDKGRVAPGRESAWFEIKYFRSRPYLGVTFRGILSTIPFLPLWYFVPTWPMAAFILAWPLALWIGTKVPGRSAWTVAETIRYPIVGIAAALLQVA